MIKILDKYTISQISAGEVVDRPLNIVKELIENSIDAGSTRIIIDIEEGGIKKISIKDNGSGISQEDLPLAFIPHATSKIQKIEDILNIQTFGFRGEALSSIGIVSKATIISKTKNDTNGYRIINNFGELSDIDIVASNDGTNIIVENLFDKIPARKKFLKSAQVEASKILDIVEKIALSHKEISFKYISDGKEKFATAGDNNLKNIIYTLYGKNIYDNAINIDNKKNGISVSGIICMPIVSRNKKDDEIFFVNGRYVLNNILYKATEEAYSQYLMQHKYPLVVLSINIEGNDIDVNVHPQKMLVRFSNNDIIYNVINETISNTLKNLELIHNETFEDDNIANTENITKVINDIKDYNKTFNNPIFENKTTNTIVNSEEEMLNEKNVIDINNLHKFDYKKNDITYNNENIKENVNDSILNNKDNIINKTQQNIFFNDDKFVKSNITDDYKYIGQLFLTYILIEYKDKLYIIDQHAAHEKIYYEKYIKELNNNETISQKIIPIVITLTPIQYLTVKENLLEFNKSGFSIDIFGEKEIIVDAVPYNLLNIGKKDLLLEMIDEFSDEKGISNYNSIKDKIATIACKKAIKGNNSLTKEESISLVKELFTLENPYNCPHGRPTIIEFSKKELEKKFGRIVT